MERSKIKSKKQVDYVYPAITIQLPSDNSFKSSPWWTPFPTSSTITCSGRTVTSTLKGPEKPETHCILNFVASSMQRYFWFFSGYCLVFDLSSVLTQT